LCYKHNLLDFADDDNGRACSKYATNQSFLPFFMLLAREKVLILQLQKYESKKLGITYSQLSKNDH